MWNPKLWKSTLPMHCSWCLWYSDVSSFPDFRVQLVVSFQHMNFQHFSWNNRGKQPGPQFRTVHWLCTTLDGPMFHLVYVCCIWYSEHTYRCATLVPHLPFLQFGGEEHLYNLMRIAFNLSPCDEAGVSVARSLHSAFCIWWWKTDQFCVEFVYDN